MRSLISISQYLLKTLNDYFNYLERFFYKKEKGKMIIISGAPRSGTTWFGEMLNSHRVRVFHEPLIKHTLLWNWHLKKNKEEPADLISLKNVLNKVEKGQAWDSFIKFNTGQKYKSPTKISPHALLGIKEGRVIIKDPGLCYFLEIFTTLQDCNIILLFRNPLSIVSSLKRLNWYPDERLKIMLEHNYFKKFNLKVPFKKLEEYSLIEKYALQTAYLHYIMLQYSKTNIHATVCFYEEMVSDPIKNFKKIFAELGLHYDKHNLNNHLVLSQNSNEGHLTNPHYSKRNSSEFKEIWKKRLTEDEIEKIINIYNSFEMGIYL